MGSEASSKSSVRFALFGVGTLLLHAAAGWALPAPAARISPDLVTFSLIEQAMLEVTVPAQGTDIAATVAGATNIAWPTKAGSRAKASLVRKRALADSRDSSVGESLHSSALSEVSPQSEQQRASDEAPASTLASGAEQADDALALAGLGSDQAQGSASSAGSATSNASVGNGDGAGAGPAVRAPALLAAGDLCASYFPSHAHVDRGEVQIDVEVDASGHAHASAVLVEAPLGQGFASAARECARWLRFAPAVSELGAPMAGRAKLKLRFKRRTV